MFVKSDKVLVVPFQLRLELPFEAAMLFVRVYVKVPYVIDVEFTKISDLNIRASVELIII